MSMRFWVGAALATVIAAFPVAFATGAGAEPAADGSAGYCSESKLTSGRGNPQTVSPASDIAISQTCFGTDFVVAGVGGLRNFGAGDITLAGVTGPVSKALLYWNGPTNSLDPTANASIIVNGTGFVGTNIGFSDDNCWAFLNTQAYMTDLTTLVQGTGNGLYALTGLDIDDATVVDGANSNGASLIVFFDDGNNANDRDVVIFHGNDSNIPNIYDADGWNVSLPGITYTSGTANLQLHVADGQDFPGDDDDALILNAATLVPTGSIFNGNTVPSANNGPIDNGSLWDIHTYDVTTFLSPGPNTLTLTTGVNFDCLGLVVAIVDLPAGAAPGDCEICGVVIDADCDKGIECVIEGACVEAWTSYPNGVIVDVDTTDEFGVFCLNVGTGVEYDIRAYAKGFCTDVEEDWECEDGRIVIGLEPFDFELPESPYFSDWWSTNATFEGFPIQPGDVIYACDSNGVILGLAYVTVPGSYLIHVSGNVPKVPDLVDEGAEPGEKISLWLNCECPVMPPQGWQNFGNYEYDAAWDCRPTGICCELCPGWNMFSYNILLPNYDREVVLATIDLNYDAVRSGRCGNDPNQPSNPLISWFEGRPVNDLEEVTPWYGYDIHMTDFDTLCIEGEFIPVDVEINLCEGWNYIPYFPMEADSRLHALQSIAGNYTNIFNLWCGEFKSFNAARPAELNDLYCLEPCKGYWIKMLSDDILTYPTDNYECDPAAKIAANSTTGRVKGSPLFADFWSTTDAATSGLHEGDIISVRTASGILAGEGTVGRNGSFLVHVFGDVPQTQDIEGAFHHEALIFEVNGVAASVEGRTTWGDREDNQITVHASGTTPVPTDYALLQNYPNPFNAGTVIPFYLKTASEWTLTVYNIMGQAVETFSGFDAAGTVRVSWNGIDGNGSSVPSGVYFYRVTTPEWTSTRKMTLLK